MKNLIFEKLNEFEIEQKTYYHKPLYSYTDEDADKIASSIPAASTKNLFLKDSKNNLYLLVAIADIDVNLKSLSKYLKAPELRFANADLLKQYLGVIPGSVTPFGLIYDYEHKLYVLLDSNLFDHNYLGFHPLENDATTVIKSEDLKKFLELLNAKYLIIDFNNLTI